MATYLVTQGIQGPEGAQGPTGPQGPAGDGSTSLFRTEFEPLMGESTLSENIGIYGGGGTLNLPALGEDEEPMAWIISAFMGTIELAPSGEDLIYLVDNSIESTYTVPESAVIHLLRYANVWRIIYDSSASGGGGSDLNPYVAFMAVSDSDDALNLAESFPWASPGVGVLVMGRTNPLEDGVYVDGVRIDPQPTFVVGVYARTINIDGNPTDIVPDNETISTFIDFGAISGLSEPTWAYSGTLPNAPSGNMFDGSEVWTSAGWAPFPDASGIGVDVFTGILNTATPPSNVQEALDIVDGLDPVQSDGTILDIVKLTQAEYDALTPVSTTFYVIVG